MRTEIYTIRGKVRTGDHISLDRHTFHKIAIFYKSIKKH